MSQDTSSSSSPLDNGVFQGNVFDEENVSTEKKVTDPASAANSDPFGDETNCEFKYKTMSWWQAGMLMIAETISLGILSLPAALATLGFVPGMILIIGLGSMATYTGYMIGQFKLRYPQVHSMADAGDIMFGPIGRELLGAAQLVFFVFIMASHVLTFSIMMNTITEHGTCSIVFGIVGTVICLILTLPRRLQDVSYTSILSFISIGVAVTVTMVGVGIEKPGLGRINVTPDVSLYNAFLATTNIVFAYAGHVAFFTFMSELRKPEDYVKSLFMLQISDVTLYLIAAAVIYNYGGDKVASPALGSASPLLAKIAYGVAIPTIVVAGVVNAHVATKYVYVRKWRGTDVMSQRAGKSVFSWWLITAVLWFVAWIIAEAIPSFSDLLGLVSALFASWFTYGLSGIFWLFMNKGRYTESKKKMALTALNCLIICVGLTIMGLGTWASGTAIHSSGNSGGAFSCADNSGRS